ncbi:MAG: hypothetical protein PUB21_04730 [Bacteroidales bacterium]|nr:hypothetical protein [Bacteroidales bacterium]
MKYVFYLIMLVPLSVFSQRLTVKSMNDNLVDKCVKVADFYLSKNITDFPSLSKVYSALKTGSEYEYFVPIFLLRIPELEQRPLSQIPLIELIDRTPSPYMQEAFFKDTSYVIIVLKGINDAINTYNEQHTQKNDCAIAALREGNIYSYEEKFKRLDLLKIYMALNPEIEVFSIYGLQMIGDYNVYWGIKDGKLIKLILDEDGVKEIDGEEYYRKIFGDIEGIERVLKYCDYEEVIFYQKMK